MAEAQNTQQEGLISRVENLTKTGAEFALAVTVFGIRQGNSVLRGRPAAAELEDVTRNVTGRFDSLDNTLFAAPNQVQQTLIGMAFDLARPQNLTPQGFTRTTTNMIRSAWGIAGRLVPGCKSCNGG